MGLRCTTPLSFLCLALASGQANVLGVQQTPSNPADPALGQNSATAVQAAPPEPQNFRLHSRSHVRLNRGNHSFDIYLYAVDEKTEVVDLTSFFGNKGDRQYSGHFQLLSVADNTIVSGLDLDPEDTFVEKKPHDGARLFRDPKSGQDLVVLFQYGTSNCESVQFFSADPSGHLFLVPFLDRDGRTLQQMLTGPEGVIPNLPNGAMVFCSYANAFGYDFCDAYAFDGANFLETAEWLTQDFEAPIKGLNDTGQATRALFEFHSELSEKRYSAAAYYVDVNLETAGAGRVTANRGQNAAFLEKYCTVMGGQCLMPEKIESKPGADALGVLLFRVSFQTSDFQPFKIGSRSSFDFRVAKTPDGFKVLDLPPRLPPENSRQ